MSPFFTSAWCGFCLTPPETPLVVPPRLLLPLSSTSHFRHSHCPFLSPSSCSPLIRPLCWLLCILALATSWWRYVLPSLLSWGQTCDGVPHLPNSAKVPSLPFLILLHAAPQPHWQILLLSSSHVKYLCYEIQH